MADTPSILVCDPVRPRRQVMLTERELELVSTIRTEKGIGPVLVLSRKAEATR